MALGSREKKHRRKTFRMVGVVHATDWLIFFTGEDSSLSGWENQTHWYALLDFHEATQSIRP